VSRSWSEFTNNEVFYSRRIITKLVGGYEDFKDTWKLVMKKADKEMMNELALAVKYFLSNHPENCNEENCNHRAWSHSPLHIGAEAGQAYLCEFILKIVTDKNPGLNEGDIGWTPLWTPQSSGRFWIHTASCSCCRRQT
jgi:hypothetical protein